MCVAWDTRKAANLLLQHVFVDSAVATEEEQGKASCSPRREGADQVMLGWFGCLGWF